MVAKYVSINSGNVPSLVCLSAKGAGAINGGSGPPLFESEKVGTIDISATICTFL